MLAQDENSLVCVDQHDPIHLSICVPICLSTTELYVCLMWVCVR